MTTIIGAMPLHSGATTAGLITNPLTINGHTITDEWLAEHSMAITFQAEPTPAGNEHPFTIKPHAIIIDGNDAYQFE